MKIDFQTSESALAIEVPGTMEIDNMVDKTDSLDTAILNAIVEHTASDYPDGAYHCASFVEFHSEKLCGVPIADGNISKELITAILVYEELMYTNLMLLISVQEAGIFLALLTVIVLGGLAKAYSAWVGTTRIAFLDRKSVV